MNTTFQNNRISKAEKLATPRMTTASQILANAGLVIPQKRQNWSMQKRVPSEILVTREIEEVKKEIHRYRGQLADNRKILNNKPSKYLVIKKKGKKGYQIIGFGTEGENGNPVPKIAKDMEQVREFAREIKRTRIKIGEKEMFVY